MRATHPADQSRLEPLRDLPALRVAPDSLDVRGWPLFADDGAGAGRVADFLVDRHSLRTEYLLVAPAGDVRQRDGRDGLLLVPLGSTRIDGDARCVRTPMARDELHALPRYPQSVPQPGAADGGAGGHPPDIRIRYQSTTALAGWGAVLAICALLLAWLFFAP